MKQDGIEWPFAVLDFEASALDPDSYPIEVGIAIWNGPMAPIICWSTLIEPAREWVLSGIWTESSQKVHGITPGDLVGAPAPSSVLKDMNRVLGASTSIVSDNPYWEDLWLKRLCAAAGETLPVHVDKLSDRVQGIGVRRLIAMKQHLADNARPHRAGDDALLIVKSLAHALGHDPRVERI